jgi:hypothetical protein
LRLEGLYGDVKDLGELLNVFGGCHCLAVEEGGDGYFVTADFFSDGLEGEVLLLFGFEECG